MSDIESSEVNLQWSPDDFELNEKGKFMMTEAKAAIKEIFDHQLIGVMQRTFISSQDLYSEFSDFVKTMDSHDPEVNDKLTKQPTPQLPFVKNDRREYLAYFLNNKIEENRDYFENWEQIDAETEEKRIKKNKLIDSIGILFYILYFAFLAWFSHLHVGFFVLSLILSIVLTPITYGLLLLSIEDDPNAIPDHTKAMGAIFGAFTLIPIAIGASILGFWLG